MLLSVANLQVVLVVKNLPANAGDIRDLGFIPGLGRSLEEGMATHSRILAWRIPWTEDPGGLQYVALQRVRHNRSDLVHMHNSYMYNGHSKFRIRVFFFFSEDSYNFE